MLITTGARRIAAQADAATRLSAPARRRGLVAVALLLAIGFAIAFAGLAQPPSLARALSAGSGYCFALVDKAAAATLTQIVGQTCGGLDAGAQLVAAGTVELPPNTGLSAAFPLRLSANGRYLVDQNDVPFLIAGDSPQALIGKLTSTDADFFMADRRKYGFNSIWINLLCDDYTGCNPNGSTADGVAPFTTAGDLATPNEVYFSRVDATIKLAAAHGFNVFLDPIETGGWLGNLRANGRQKAYDYGVYLGRRYRDAPNIVWLNGNDFQTWNDAVDDDLALAVAQGIAATDPIHLQTLELNYHVSSSLDDPRWASILGLNTAYTYFPTYAEVLKGYNRESSKPVLMIEANYEMQNSFRGPLTLRKQEYWSMLSGASGQLYGSRYTWQFADGWKTHLDTLGSTQMAFVAGLFGSRRWFDLVPDQEHTLVTAGFGTFSDFASVNDNDYATAGSTSDGKLGMVYVPSERSISIDMGRLAGPVRAEWYDPTNGSYSSISGTPLESSGVRHFHTPGRNSSGDGDWVLVLEQADPVRS